MAKSKHQKSKAIKKPTAKKHGKQTDLSEFGAHLHASGLKIIQVTADGNCFFRALADQLEGNEDEHGKYRNMVVQFIAKNREMFEPFIEDDVPFDEYCQSMEKDGTWAGHMELQAASLVTHSNICIHRNMSPRWYIKNFDHHEAQMIHLSYHDGEHYNSVRLKEDTCSGPARPIIIKADADLSVASDQARNTISNTKDGVDKNMSQTEMIKMVIAGSGCENLEKVQQVLSQVGGDIDSAIEFLIAEGGTGEYLVGNDKSPHSEDTPHGNDRLLLRSIASASYTGDEQNKNSEIQEEDFEGAKCKQDTSCDSMGRIHNGENLRNVEKKIPRNKMCPCGSKKKYKSCCGSVAGRSSARFAVSQTVDYSKGQKDKKQGKSRASVNIADSHESGGPPDVGALCI